MRKEGGMTMTTITNGPPVKSIEVRVVEEAVVRTSMMSVVMNAVLTREIQLPTTPTTATAATRTSSSLAQNETAARATTHLTTAVI